MSFRSFVIFAGMRTGSNLLEATLNAIKGVTCFGEAFNPHMLGWPDKHAIRKITRPERDADPLAFLEAMLGAPNLNGFRYFHDHDPRVLEAILTDTRCAKIILTRNPVDSYVSTRLAIETNQWKLNETETPITARVTIDPRDFVETLEAQGDFLRRVRHRLQTTAQTPFILRYPELRDADVLTGLLHWLGRTDLERVEPARDPVPQNPRALEEKVSNPEVLHEAVARLDPFLLDEVPCFEARRGPATRDLVACEAGRGLLWLPLSGAPDLRPALETLGEVTSGLHPGALRAWKRAHPGHRTVVLLADPLARAWAAFARVLTEGGQGLLRTLAEVHRVPIPLDRPEAALDDPKAFAAFLGVLRRTLNGQTSLPTRTDWASQTEVVAAIARTTLPDAVLRPEEAAPGLAQLLRTVGVAPETAPAWPATPSPPLASDDLAQLARRAYGRDVEMFGL